MSETAPTNSATEGAPPPTPSPPAATPSTEISSAQEKNVATNMPTVETKPSEGEKQQDTLVPEIKNTVAEPQAAGEAVETKASDGAKSETAANAGDSSLPKEAADSTTVNSEPKAETNKTAEPPATENTGDKSVDSLPTETIPNPEVTPPPTLEVATQPQSQDNNTGSEVQKEETKPEAELKETKLAGSDGPPSESDKNAQPLPTKIEGEGSENTEEGGEEQCVNIDELTEHVMNIINEGVAKENSSQDELQKRNMELQQFIVKLIHLLKEKTDLSINLERQNSALISQAKSLKDVIAITKDLLGIRNMEIEHLHKDLDSMQESIKQERNRHNTAIQHLNEAMGLNDKLKAEYLTQMDLFEKLKEKYTEKVVLLTRENIRLNSLMQQNGIDTTAPATPSSEPPPSNENANQSESVNK